MSTTRKFPLPSMGIDLLSAETALVNGAVREATNVDIGRAGTFSRRVGQELLIARGDMHSLWRAVQRGRTFVGAGSALYTIDANNDLTLVAPLASAAPLAYTEYNGNVYWSNAAGAGWLPSDSRDARPVGVPTPTVNPTLSVGAGGLAPGKYAVVLTAVDSRGEESGATAVQTIDLPNGGGITLSGLPTSVGTNDTVVYITDPDGEKLRAAARFPAVFPSYTIADVATGRDCDTQFLAPMPAGTSITWLAGRLYTAKNNVLSFSEALRPHLHNPAHGFVQFSGLISFIEAVTDGIYVGDSRGVWFMAGTDPTKFEMVPVSTCRAVRGSSIKIPPEHLPEKEVTSANPVALWLSTSGYVVGMDGGVTVEMHPDRVKVPSGLAGRTAYLFRDGLKQVVTPVNSTSTAAFGIAVDSPNPLGEMKWIVT